MSNTPQSNRPLPVIDATAEFERLSRQQPRNPAAERAFVQAKLDALQRDSSLTEEQRQSIRDSLMALLDRS